MSSGYLRYPHVHGDLLTFVAGNDVWLAPAAGGRAWRLSADDVPVSYPRFSRDGSRVAWSSSRDGNPEVYCAEVDGSTAARLTYWGDPQTRVTGWTAADEVLAITCGEPAGHQVPASLRRSRRRHATPPAAVRRRHRRGHRGRRHCAADQQRGRRARVLEALSRRPDRQAVDRDARGPPVHPGAGGPGRPAGQPDADRRAAVLPVRSRGHRQHLLLRAGRQRHHSAYRSLRPVRQEPGHRRAADRVPRGRRHLAAGRPGRGGAAEAGGHPRLPGRGPGASADLGEGSPGRPGLRSDRPGQRGRGTGDGALAGAQGRPGPCAARGSGARAGLPRVLGDTGQVVWVTDAPGPTRWRSPRR